MNQIISIHEIKKVVNLISEKHQPEKIILFGSYADGQPTPDSDVDLLVIMNTQKPTWELCVDISAMLRHSFPMDILVRTPKEIEKRLALGDFFLKEIIEKGKVVYERVGE